MIFSIIVALTNGLTTNLEKLSILHPPFLLGMIAGGAVIYWFTGAATQAVTTGAYRAVEFIKKNIRLEGVTKAVDFVNTEIFSEIQGLDALETGVRMLPARAALLRPRSRARTSARGSAGSSRTKISPPLFVGRRLAGRGSLPTTVTSPLR